MSAKAPASAAHSVPKHRGGVAHGRGRGWASGLLRRVGVGIALAGGLWLAAVGKAEAAPELIYYHSETCPYCKQWEAEVGPMYDKTDEGARLPLRPVSADEPWPEDLAHIRGVVFTPTFIVLDDEGQEVGRIMGYQPEWFWAYLRKYIDQMDARQKEEGAEAPS